MDDKIIIQHYWERDERAIDETAEKYGGFCTAIAEGILNNREDAAECVNDTYLKTWNSIPPQKPKVFPAFIGKIVRNLSFNRYIDYVLWGKNGLPLAVEEAKRTNKVLLPVRCRLSIMRTALKNSMVSDR